MQAGRAVVGLAAFLPGRGGGSTLSMNRAGIWE